MRLKQAESSVPVSQSHTSFAICTILQLLYLWVHTWNCQWHRNVCEWGTVLGVPIAQLWECESDASLVVTSVDFLMESAKSLVGSVSLWCPLRAHQTSLPQLTPLPVVQHTSLFWMGQGRSGYLWQHSTHPGKLDTHSKTRTFPHGRNQSPIRFLLAMRCTTLKEGTGRVKQLLLHSSLFIISDFFFSNSVLNFSTEHLDFHSHHFWCMFIKIAFLGGGAKCVKVSVLSFFWHYSHQAWIQGLKEFMINNHIQWLILFCP